MSIEKTKEKLTRTLVDILTRINGRTAAPGKMDLFPPVQIRKHVAAIERAVDELAEAAKEVDVDQEP